LTDNTDSAVSVNEEGKIL